MIYRVLYFIVKLLSFIPYPISQTIGKNLGIIFYFIGTRIFRIDRLMVSQDNIKRSLGLLKNHNDSFQLNRKVMVHFCQMLFEIPHILRIDRNNYKQYFYTRPVISIGL